MDKVETGANGQMAVSVHCLKNHSKNDNASVGGPISLCHMTSCHMISFHVNPSYKKISLNVFDL